MVGESTSGASPESESRAHKCAHLLAHGGVRWREDLRLEARRSLVDARVPPGG